MQRNGFISILPLVIILILIALGVGSFIYLKPTIPTATPAPGAVIIDKTRPISGVLLVTFKSGTNISDARSVLAKHQITEFSEPATRTTLSSTDIFRLRVTDGQEQQMAGLLREEAIVQAVSLDYNN